MFDAEPMTLGMGDRTYLRLAGDQDLPDALVSLLDDALQVSSSAGDAPPLIVTLTAPTLLTVVDMTQSTDVLVNLSGFNLTGLAVSNPTDGKHLRVLLMQGGTAATATLPGAADGFRWVGGDANKPTLPSVAGAVIAFDLVYSSFASAFVEVDRSSPKLTVPATQLGVISLSDPAYAGGLSASNSSTQNDAVLNAAISSGASVLVAPAGVFSFAGAHNFGNCDLVGQGGGFGISATQFKATAAAAQFNFDGGGSSTGGFRINGNGVAVTPFRRQPTTASSSGRHFYEITVLNNADDGTTHTNPLCAIIGPQNDTYDLFVAYASVHDILLLDGGCGGLTFNNMELAQAGRSHIRFDNQVTVSTVYSAPANINFFGGRCEGTVGLGSLYFNAGASISFYNVSLFSTNVGTGPLIDVVNASDINFDSGWYQQVGAPGLQASSIGLVVRGTSTVSLTGGQRWANFNKVFQLDGVSCSLDMKQSGHYYNSNIRIDLLNGASLVQASTFIDGTLFIRDQYNNTPILVSYNAGQNGLFFQMLNTGKLQWFAGGAGAFSVEDSLERIGPGVIGMTAGAFADSYGNTAGRPATPLTGTVYWNTDFDAQETWSGTKWVRPADIWRGVISASSPTAANVNAVLVIPIVNPPIPGSVIANNNAGAVNDSATWRGAVGPGTWTFRCWYLKLNSGGIVNIDYSLDEGTTWVSVASGLDLYAVTGVSAFVDKTGVVVTNQKTVLLRWKVTGKNASSSANAYLAGQMELVRTS